LSRTHDLYVCLFSHHILKGTHVVKNKEHKDWPVQALGAIE